MGTTTILYSQQHHVLFILKHIYDDHSVYMKEYFVIFMNSLSDGEAQ